MSTLQQHAPVATSASSTCSVAVRSLEMSARGQAQSVCLSTVSQAHAQEREAKECMCVCQGVRRVSGNPEKQHRADYWMHALAATMQAPPHMWVHRAKACAPAPLLEFIPPRSPHTPHRTHPRSHAAQTPRALDQRAAGPRSCVCQGRGKGKGKGLGQRGQLVQ